MFDDTILILYLGVSAMITVRVICSREEEIEDFKMLAKVIERALKRNGFKYNKSRILPTKSGKGRRVYFLNLVHAR